MTTSNVHQAKTNLSKLLNAAADGEEVIITRRGGKVTRFRLQPVPAPKTNPLWGAFKGMATISDEEWDELDRQIADDFEQAVDKDDF